MISRTHRFHGRASLRFVHQRGKTSRGPFFLVKVALNPRRTNYRVAVVVSAKVHKSAVVRNRIRRRLYSAVRQQTISQPYDIVINVFDSKVADQPPKDLLRLVKRQLSAAGVL
ncbi:MAG TPA: ribonuclease P protein component [Candidatus Nitrosopolaris sp.]|nr:ribonuclease P protein component [Candidatus Nitrosopolaris sp.]